MRKQLAVIGAAISTRLNQQPGESCLLHPTDLSLQFHTFGKSIPSLNHDQKTQTHVRVVAGLLRNSSAVKKTLLRSEL
jgi:hypothetical protein